MSARVKVTIKDRVTPAREFVFGNRMICTVGRAHDCYLQFPGDLLHRAISRHHCLLDIDPPQVRIRDLGSRNGTYVNGKNIGQRRRDTVPETAAVADLPECVVHEGDTIRLGDTALEVTICVSEDSVNAAGQGDGNISAQSTQSPKPLCD